MVAVILIFDVKSSEKRISAGQFSKFIFFSNTVMIQFRLRSSMI